jgi:hypothetical protein
VFNECYEDKGTGHVMLTKQVTRPLHKLTEHWIGPYQVILVHTNSVGLLFSKSVKARHIVNVSRVKPYIEPLPGQPIVCPGPVSVNNEGTSEFEVDYIIDSHPIGRGFQYLVHWKGYDESDHTWEPASGLKNAQATVNNFHRQNPSASRHLKMNRTVEQRDSITLCLKKQKRCAIMHVCHLLSGKTQLKLLSMCIIVN